MDLQRPFKTATAWYQETLGAIEGGTWSLPRLFAFRTLLLFILIGETELVREVFSLGEFLSLPNSGPPRLDPLTLWFGDFAFGLDLSSANPRLSDSKPYAWVNNATYLTLSMLIAGIWSALGRRQRAHPLLYDGLWTLIRMIVALHMFGYGFAKIFGLQFVLPSATVMMREVGSLNPAELMKVFMGTSQPYSAMAGWAEVVGGTLLCFRRSTLLGGLLTLVVVTNVFAMNLFYNFGVQRLSLELTLMIFFILTPHLRSLMAVIIFNRGSAPLQLHGPWTQVKWRRAGLALMTLWCAVNLGSKATGAYDFAYHYGELGPRGDLDGTWSVDTQSVDGESELSKVPPEKQWRSITFMHRPKWTEATIGRRDSSHESYRFFVDGDQIILTEMSWDEDLSGVKRVGALGYRKTEDGVMQVEGELAGSQMQAKLIFKPQSAFNLLNGDVGLIRKP